MGNSSAVYFLLAMVFIILSINTCTALQPRTPVRYTKVCGRIAKDFLQFYCRDNSFKFPFPFNRNHLTVLYPPPRKNVYPFQHQAAVCCRRGCQEIGFNRMCQYHKNLPKCERGIDKSTRRGKIARAKCLLRVDARLQPGNFGRLAQRWRHRGKRSVNTFKHI